MTDIVELGFKADTSGIVRTDKALDNLGKTGDRTADKLDKSAKQVNSTFTELNATLGIVGATLAALGSAALTRELIQYSDTWKSVNNQLRQVTDSNKDLIATQQLIVDLAKETRSDLLSTTELYSELTRATESLETTQEEVISVTKTLNNLFLAGGKSAQESSGAIRQLGQALGAGALRGDEFNSVAEGAPRILDALSESLGMAKGELREFAATGGITAEILVDALLEYEDAAQSAADKTDITFAQIREVTQTNTTEAIGSISALDRVVSSLGLGMVGLSESFAESANAIDFVITELEREMAISFARIGGFFEVVGAEIEFSLSNPIDFAIGKIIDLSQALIEFGSFAGQFLGLNTEVLDQWVMNLEEIRPKTVAEHNATLNEIRGETERVIGLLNEQYDSYGDKIIENLVVKQSAAIEETEELEEAQKKLAKSIGISSTEIDKILDNSIDKFDRLGASFTNTGNGIIDTFGEAVSVLTEFGNRIEYITEEQEKYRSVLESQNATIEQQQQAKMALTKLDEAALSANLAGISSLLGASANLFKEQSKEREILHRLEMGFLAAEMALAAEKAIVNAVNAITNQGSGDPYTAFVRIPAMAAIMAGLLGAIGASIGSTGGGYSAPTAGTGTVLGDSEAQSGSISAGVEMFEDIQLDQLAELRGIRSSMSDLAGAIGQVTKSIIGSNIIDTGFVQGLGKTGSGSFLKDFLSGNPINAIPIIGDIAGAITSGLFGSTKRTLIDSGVEFLSQTFGDIFESGQVEANVFAVIEKTKKKLFGLIRSSSTEIQTQAIDNAFATELANIFTSIGETIVQSTALLGFGSEEALLDRLSSFNFESFQISTEGKTGEEIQEELEAAFSAQADLMAEFLLPQLSEFQQLGEGLYETLLRVTKEQVIFNDALRSLGMNIDNLNNSTLLEFSQAVIEASGGLDNFTDSFNTFYDKFFTEEEKALNILSSLTAVFADLGLELPDTMEEFRDLVEQTAMLGESGADTFAVLLSVSDAFAEMVETLNELNNSALQTQQAVFDLSQFFFALREHALFPSFNMGATSEMFDMWESALARLIEDFGSSGAVVGAIQGFSDFFLDEATRLEVARSGLFSGVVSIVDELSNLLTPGGRGRIGDLRDLLADGEITSMGQTTELTAESLSRMFRDAVMFASTSEVESGLLTSLLSLSPSIQEYIEMLRQQEEATRAATEALENQRLGLYVELLDEQGHAQEALAIKRQQELESMDESLRPLQSLIWLQEDWNKAIADSENALGSALDMLSSAVASQSSEISNIISSLDSAMDSISSGLRNLESARIGTMDVALRELDRILASARGGDFSGIGQLDISTLTAGSTSGFSTAMDFNLAQARIGVKLEELAQLTQEERDSQQTELDALNSMMELAQQQYDAITGVEEAITDAEAANVLFNQRLIELQALQLASQDTSLEGQQEFADLQLALIEAQNVNFLALMDLTDDQRQQIVDHLISLNQVNESFNETFANSFALLTANMADWIGGNNSLNATLRELTSNQWHGMNKLNATLRELTSNQWHGLNKTNDLLTQLDRTTLEIADKAILQAIKDLDKTTLEIVDKAILKELQELNRTTLEIADKGILANTNRTANILRELTSNQWHGLNKTNDLLTQIRDSGFNKGGSGGSAGSDWQLNKIISHQQDIDYNTHVTAARTRIGNGELEGIRNELVKMRTQMSANDEKERRYLSSIDKNTEETERNLKKLELNGIRLRAS